MAEFTSHEAAAHKAQSLPVMMQPKPIGRDPILVQVYNQLKANQPIVIYGAAGMGKSALAATLASAYTELPGGSLWLNVDNPSLEELIVRVGRAYGALDIAASSNPLGMVAAVASTFSANRPLIVLDGRLEERILADFIKRCAPQMPLLVLNKEPLQGEWTTLELGKLDFGGALALLKQHTELNSTDVERDLDELASILDYNPFALTIAAATIRYGKISPAEYLSEFEKIPSSSGATPQLLALTIAYRRLNKALQGVILLLGATFGAPVSSELLSTMANAPQDTVEQVMQSLANQRLIERIERYDSPYYRLHEITAGFASTLLKSQGQLETLQSKVRDSLVAYIRKYAINSPAAYDKLAGSMDLVMAVARWCAEQGDRELVTQLVVSLMQSGDFVNERGYVFELVKLREMSSSFTKPFPANQVAAAAPEDMELQDIVETAAELDEDDEDFDDEFDDDDEVFDEDEPFDDELVQDLDKDIDEVVASSSRATAAANTASLWQKVEQGETSSPRSLLDIDDDDDDDEIEAPTQAALPLPTADVAPDDMTGLQNALRQAKQQNDFQRQVSLLGKIGQLEAKLGQDTNAINTYTEALDVYENLDDQPAILETLDTLATLMVKTENSSAAVLHATRGIQLANTLGDSETKMFLLIALADARQQLGESPEAVKSYGQALEIARGSGDQQNEGLILYKLGYAQLDNNQPDTAAETWETALTLFKTQKKRDYEGRVLGALGTAYGELSRWEEAINFHTSALYIAREVRDREVEALELSNLGYASVQANQLGQALLRYRQALHLAYQANNKENIVSNIVDIVRLLAESPKHLGIADLLLNDAIPLDPTDRDVLKLKERVTGGKIQAVANETPLLPVSGTAKDYAANAYQLLEQ